MRCNTGFNSNVRDSEKSGQSVRFLVVSRAGRVRGYLVGVKSTDLRAGQCGFKSFLPV